MIFKPCDEAILEYFPQHRISSPAVIMQPKKMTSATRFGGGGVVFSRSLFSSPPSVMTLLFAFAGATWQSRCNEMITTCGLALGQKGETGLHIDCHGMSLFPLPDSNRWKWIKPGRSDMSTNSPGHRGHNLGNVDMYDS